MTTNDSVSPSVSTRTAYSYLRFSSSKQVGNDSLTRQLHVTRSVCREKGWILDESIRPDMGVSGYRGKNIHEGNLAKFVELHQQGKLVENPILIIEKMDRLSRAGISESLPFFQSLLKSGVSVYCCADSTLYQPCDADNVMKIMMIVVSLAQANQFSENLSKNIKSAKVSRLQKIESGLIVKCEDLSPSWVDWDSKKQCYVVNEKADLIRKIFDYYTKDLNTLNGIAKKLNQAGIKASRGAIWSPTQIRFIITNPKVTGKLYDRENYFPAIVSKDQFDIAQALVRKNKNRRGRTFQRVNLFRNLIFCSECGKTATITSSTWKSAHATGSYFYFICSNYKTKGGCTQSRMVNLDDLERYVFINLFQQSPEDLIGKDSKAIVDELKKVESRISNVSNRITQLLEADDLNLKEVKPILTKLNKEKSTLGLQLQDLKSKQLSVGRSSVTMNELSRLLNTTKEGIPGKVFRQFVDEMNKTHSQLQDHEFRKQVRPMVAGLISRIEINFNMKLVTIYGIDGQVVRKNVPINFPIDLGPLKIGYGTLEKLPHEDEYV